MTVTLYAGADVRDDPDKPDPSWDADRRRQYLLRSDVSRPLSVDRMVWRSPLGPELQTIADRLPWITVDQVRHAVASWPRRHGDAWVTIAIGVVAADSAEEAFLKETTAIDTELRIERDWTFLGYDVADGGDCSGLCNCGYREEDEAIVSRAQWAPRLNEHGLLVELRDALEFRSLTNHRVPEHSPFFVGGLWIAP
jgi:hypothetical protein